MTDHIQIRSFVLGGNHGQFLQADGLRRAVTALRGDARVTHARYNAHLGQELRTQLRSLQPFKFAAMRLLWERRIPMSPLDTPAAMTVYGSDQIWAFSNPSFHVDPVLFGTQDPAVKIAYAPSMGHVEADFVAPDWLAPALRDFKAIAMRDTVGRDTVAGLLGHDVPIVTDPALFLPQLDDDPLPPSARDGTLSVYCLRTSQTIPALCGRDGAKGRAVFEGMRLHGYAPRRQAWRHIHRQFETPDAIIRSIRSSRLLLTSTFHGVMMALLAGTPFIALTTPGLSARLQNPVGQRGFSPDRLVDMKTLRGLTPADITRLCETGDMDRALIRREVAAARDWLRQALDAGRDSA